MGKISKLFASPEIRKIYVSYFLMILLVLVTIVFVVNSYQDLQSNQQTPPQLADRAVVLAAAMQTLSHHPQKKQLHGPVKKGIHVALSKSPPADASLIMEGDFKTLSQSIMLHPDHFSISMPLKDGQWLTLKHHARSQQLFMMGFVLSAVVLLGVLAALLFSLVSTLSYPLHALVKAADRFRVDMQAPPVALTGPKNLQKALAAFNHMQSRVKQLVADRTQMLAAISHDLRTPITRLQLRAEFMQDKAQQQKALADLAEMEQMISSILSFAQDYTAKESLSHFDLNALLQTICDQQQDVGADVDYQGTSRVAFSGRVQALRRAFTNLIENAVKYGEKARVSCSLKEHQVCIKIIDEGPGIPDGALEKVFRPFYRLDKARTSGAGGSGLGLAVARDIILSHEGRVTLTNRQQGGLQVTVVLPSRLVS